MLNYRKSLLSLALVSITIAANGISSKSLNAAIATNPETPHSRTQNPIIAQNYTGWVARFWQRRPLRRNGARDGVCAVSPGLVDTYMVWSNRPVFLWHSGQTNKEVQLILRDYDSQEIVWSQPTNLTEQKVAYRGQQPLQPGKIYQWQLTEKSRNTTNWATFKVLPATERDKITTELQKIEQQLKAAKTSPEEIAMKKADYFLNYQIQHQTEDKSLNLWSDALESLYQVENPSPSFIQKRQTFVSDICTENPASTSKIQ